MESLLHSVKHGLQEKEKRGRKIRVTTIVYEQKQSIEALDSGLLLQAEW